MQAEETQNWLKAYDFLKTKLGNMEEENNHLKVMMKRSESKPIELKEQTPSGSKLMKLKEQKFPTISIDYLDKVSEDADDVVVFSIGKLVVGGTGSSKEIARENAAQCMFNMVENILVNEGTETLKKNIIEGEIQKTVPKPQSLWRKTTHSMISCPKCGQNIVYSSDKKVTANSIMDHMTNTCLGSIVL